jgi:transcriptional regulator with XRE-family HTH domain
MNRIKKFRQAAHVTQNRLSVLSGVSRATIVRLENTGMKPHKATAEKIAKVLGVAPDVLTGAASETYKWQDAMSYEPDLEGFYLCAYRRKYLKEYRYKVLTWRNRRWVDESMDGYIVEYVDPAKIVWWAAIEEPPELPKRITDKARKSE